MKINDVISFLDSAFHPEYQEDYDNAGFLVGNSAEEYRGALVALDLTDEVVAEAKANGLNLIVTHHPVIFSGVKRITESSALGQLLLNLYCFLLLGHVAFNQGFVLLHEVKEVGVGTGLSFARLR